MTSGTRAGEKSTKLERRDLGSGGLNVCLAAPNFYPDYSGAGLRFLRYAPGLLERGVRMHVVSPTAGAWKRYRRYEAADPGDSAHSGKTTSSIDVQRVSIPNLPLPRRARRLATRWIYESAVLDRARSTPCRPDVIVWLNLSAQSVPILRRTKREGISTAFVQTIFPTPGAGSLLRRARSAMDHLHHRVVDCVVTSSGVMRDELRSRGIRTRMEVVSHGVDLSRFRPAASLDEVNSLRQQLGLDPNAELVLFVGPINERKGLDVLAAAWGEIAGSRPRARLVLVGPEQKEDGAGRMSFGDRIRSILDASGGADRVHFVGPVQDVDRYYRAADVFVFPSRREGMPNVVLEAFASGLPSVLTPFLGLPEEFGEPGREYVLIEREAKELARSVVGLLHDPTRRRTMGAAARRWAAEELDVERTLDRLAEIFKDLAGRTP